MTEILTDLSSAALAAATKASLYAYFRALRHSTNAAVRENDHSLRWLTGIPLSWFNGLLSNQEPPGNATQMVEETLAYFQSQGASNFSWWLAPHLGPDAWAEHLLPRGFRYDDSTPGMAMHLDALPPLPEHPLIIREVSDRQDLETWADVLVRGFEMPEELTPHFLDLFDSLETDIPAHHYLGFLNGTAVTTSTLLLDAGVAGIYNVATIPEARGQGAGSLMTLAPLHAAREMGYRAGVLQSSDMGYGVYQRLGFQKLTQVDYFQWQAPSE